MGGPLGDGWPVANLGRWKEVFFMAKNAPRGPGRRGAVKDRSQFVGHGGRHVKRDTRTGRILDVKADRAPFKGVPQREVGR